jgi:hypothetical protein
MLLPQMMGRGRTLYLGSNGGEAKESVTTRCREHVVLELGAKRNVQRRRCIMLFGDYVPYCGLAPQLVSARGGCAS